MRPRTALPAAATRLIEQQAGVITTAQLMAGGVTRRVADRFTADWVRLAQGLYLVGTPRWESAAWAGLLRGGSGAAIGGHAACFLEGALRDPPMTILVWARSTRSGFRIGDCQVEFRRGTPPAYRTPARTRIHESLLDAARGSDERDTIATIASALSRNVADPGRLLAALTARERQPHRATIEALCEPAARGVHSLIEWLFLRDVVRAHGLPDPELQVERSAGRVDEHFAQFNTIVELDGQRDHNDWSKDMYRDNQHLLDHATFTLRYGLGDVLRRPCAVAAQVMQRFLDMGWSGPVRLCAECRAA